MCGICGVIGSENQSEAAVSLERMMRAMEHRGPDGNGTLIAPCAAMGMQRLSIIDLPGGQQPIWNEAGTLAVVFNGEIYNFVELRKSLQAAGHMFRTQSDTEVIVHAYETWGQDCVRHFRGMFALAIAEMPEGGTGRPRRIFLARDRMGIKPLYYAIAEGKFFFASEVRALLASNCLSRRLSSAALASYLLFGSVGEPMTLVDGIYSLPPGHCGYVSCDAPSASFAHSAYWGVADVVEQKASSARGASPAARVRSMLEDSVRCHLLADVPLGIFLSSGVDSTALAALASRERSGIKTFTVIFPEQEFSEAALARRTAERLGTNHAELLLTGDEMRSRLDEAIAAFDQPSADGINTFFVSWAARQTGLKVALSGLGSDEIFGGYSTFSSTPQIARMIAGSRWLPSPLREAPASVLRAWAAHTARPDAALKAAAAFSGPADFPHPYFFTRALFPPRSVSQLLRASRDGWRKSLWWQWLASSVEETAPLNAFSAVSWLETRSYLVNMLLRDTDTMSMSHPLEVRVPFLDHPLVEFAIGLPASVKNRDGMRKALLIEALGDLLPSEIVAQTKRTFTLPWEAWLRGPLRQRVESSLADCDQTLGEIIDKESVKNTWRSFLAGRTSWSRPWSLFVLNEWVRRNLAGNAASASGGDKKAASALS
ncbi:MAG TPA: asparagine synthase (glutamine-hydrolyzing) [Candidatus Limnocylindrales bacterium]|nr:asparagine synthase (glutamine-hydrolyzing) [Candidatus Limnocylindrales bacterium]